MMKYTSMVVAATAAVALTGCGGNGTKSQKNLAKNMKSLSKKYAELASSSASKEKITELDVEGKKVLFDYFKARCEEGHPSSQKGDNDRSVQNANFKLEMDEIEEVVFKNRALCEQKAGNGAKVSAKDADEAFLKKHADAAKYMWNRQHCTYASWVTHMVEGRGGKRIEIGVVSPFGWKQVFDDNKDKPIEL